NGTPGWQNLNGGTSVPNPAGTTTDWWSNVAGYIDGSSNHVIIIGNSNPTTAAQGLMRLVIPSTYPGTGSITYSNQVASVTTATEPPGYTWWHFGGNYKNWLGGGAFFCPFVSIDASNLAAVNLWCAGSEGSFRNLAGAGWQLADSGMPQFLGHPVAANPVHAGHLVFGDSDWCVWDDTSPGTETASTLVNDPPPGGNEGWSCAISADGGTVYACQGAKYQNANGEVWSRPWNQPSNWSTMGLKTHTAGKVAIGLCAFNDAASTQILLAAVWGSGLWRWNGSAWSLRSSSIGGGGSTGNQLPVTYYGNGRAFAYDRKTGIYRSNDYGLSWTLVWNKTSNDYQSGTVAYDVTVPGRLWVSAGGKLYKLGGADTGTVAGGGITGTGTDVTPSGKQAGPLGTDGNGGIYLVTQDTGTGSGMLRTTNDGAVWADVTGGDGSFGKCNSGPEFVSIGPVESSGLPKRYGSGSNVVAWGCPGSAPSQGSSSAFTPVQLSLNNAGTAGVLSLWFSQAGGVPSARGSLLVARIQTSDGTATITPPAGWVPASDKAAASATNTSRVLTYYYANNPGGIGGGVNSVVGGIPARTGRGGGGGVTAAKGRGAVTGGRPRGHAPLL